MNLILILFLFWSGPKEGSKTITRSYEVSSQNQLIVVINNVYGSIEVVPSTTGKVELELQIEIEAASDELIARAKKELTLGEYLTKDTVGFYTKAPFVKECDEPLRFGWRNNDDPPYDFKYNYVVKMPAGAKLNAKTVNDGSVLIENIKGTIVAGNVNGGVEIRNAESVESASSVNGDVNVSFTKAPSKPIRFNTVNGDFNLKFPENLAAKVYFSTLNGEMYSAFDYRPAEPLIEKSDQGMKYKIASKTGVEIGSGGPVLDFKSVNGNVYLNKLN